MLKVGITGLGFMGWIHWLAYQKIDEVQVVAVCEADAKKLTGDWTSIQGNFGPPGEQVDLSNVATYSDMDEMLANEQLDYVDICLPPGLHCPFALAAAKAGVNVFTEKPMALQLSDCQTMVDACAKSGSLLMVGHVLPFFKEYAYVLDVVRSGKFGKVTGGYFKRVISEPTWLPHFFDPDRVGGPMLDLHVHDAHLIRLLFGMPTQVTSHGRMRGEVVEYCNSLFGFGDDRVVSSCSGVISQQGRPFTHGFEIHLEQATLHYEFGAFADTGESFPLKVLTEDGEVVRPELPDGDEVDSFAAELTEVARAVSAGVVSDILGGDLAMDAIRICQMETDSVRTGKTIT